MSTARQEIEAERSAHANAVETLERLDRKLHRTFLAPIGTMLHGLSLACSLVYSSRSHEQVLVETRQAHRVKISVSKLETATKISLISLYFTRLSIQSELRGIVKAEIASLRAELKAEAEQIEHWQGKKQEKNIAPTLRKYSRIYRELVDSFLRIILSGIFLVVAKGLGSIEVLVESFFLLGIAYVSRPCGVFFVLRVWFAHRGFGYDFGFLVFWILDLGVWILEFDFGPQPYGWVLLALGVLRALIPSKEGWGRTLKGDPALSVPSVALSGALLSFFSWQMHPTPQLYT